MKIDLLEIDLKAGKHFMQQVQEERIAEKRKLIRDKHRAKRLQELKQRSSRSEQQQ